MIGNGKREMRNGVRGSGQAFRSSNFSLPGFAVETLRRDCGVRGLNFGVFVVKGRQTKV
jgi:hypothetical protein